MFELCGIDPRDLEGLTHNGVRRADVYQSDVKQQIGPPEFDDGFDGDGPYFWPVTIALLTTWADINGVDPASVRVVLEEGSMEYRQIIKGRKR